MEQEPVLSARRDSKDLLPPDMSEEKPPSSPRRSLLRPLWEVPGSFRPVYERLRGAPVLGLGVCAAKGWTIAGLLASALAVGVGLTVGTLPGGSTVAAGALFVAGAAVALWMVITRWTQRNRRRQGRGNPGC